jgi:hypothetical protein
LSEGVLLPCMAKVDLNPLRTSLCNTPEASDPTSIKERIAPSFDLKKATEIEKDGLEFGLKKVFETYGAIRFKKTQCV